VLPSTAATDSGEAAEAAGAAVFTPGGRGGASVPTGAP